MRAAGTCDTRGEERILPSSDARSHGHTDPGVSLALARERAALVSGLKYTLHLTLPAEPAAPITGALRIVFSLADAVAPLVLDFAPGTAGSMDRLVVNGSASSAYAAGGHLELPAGCLQRGVNTVDVAFTAGNDDGTAAPTTSTRSSCRRGRTRPFRASTSRI